MSFGKLYTFEGNSRSTAIKAVAKENKLDVEVVNTTDEQRATTDYHKLNKLGKVPTFVGADGYELTEAIAIAIYFTSQNEKTALLGHTKQDYASIVRWLSFANSECLPAIAGWFCPLTGREPYNQKNVRDSEARTLKTVGVLEQHLLVNTFLVGERITLADLFTTGILARGYQYVFGKEWRSKYPCTTRWFETVYNQPMYQAVAEKLNFIDEPIKYTPPKKEEKPKAAPKADKPKPKPKEEERDEEEDEAPAAPKPKHPLEGLPKATLVLDDWKRKYSNEETREVALPWFWENFKADEYSIWKVEYKYNDELTMTFMTSNLIGGFFTRLEASRKYIFGCASVYGQTNDSIVQGAFVIRGQEEKAAFDVAPDYDSYSFTKLDPSSEKDREFVNDQWSWDKPITVDGKEYPWADGKVFK